MSCSSNHPLRMTSRENLSFLSVIALIRGKGLAMPEFVGPFSRSAYLVNKRSLFLLTLNCLGCLYISLPSPHSNIIFLRVFPVFLTSKKEDKVARIGVSTFKHFVFPQSRLVYNFQTCPPAYLPRPQHLDPAHSSWSL